MSPVLTNVLFSESFEFLTNWVFFPLKSACFCVLMILIPFPYTHFKCRFYDTIILPPDILRSQILLFIFYIYIQCWLNSQWLVFLCDCYFWNGKSGLVWPNVANALQLNLGSALCNSASPSRIIADLLGAPSVSSQACPFLRGMTNLYVPLSISLHKCFL